MDQFELLLLAYDYFKGRGADLGHLIGDYDEPHNLQTYGSGADNERNRRLYSDLVNTAYLKIPGLDQAKAERAVQAALAIVRQSDYAGRNISAYNRNDVNSTISGMANSLNPIGELVYNGDGVLDGHANMKQKVSTGAYDVEKIKETQPAEPEAGSEAARFAKADAEAKAKAEAEAKAKAGILKAGTGQPGDPLITQADKPAPKPGDSPMLDWTAEQKAAGNLPSQGATDPFANLAGAEAAYLALTPAQIAGGLPTSLAGGFSPFAQRTYQRMLQPLVGEPEEGGVFEFLSLAGIAPRIASPTDPTTTNRALSFRAFLSQDPAAITQNISEGLSILESAKQKASTNMQSFLQGVGSTPQERLLYETFLENPGAELNLRTNLAKRAYSGPVGDAIEEALTSQFLSTQATNPIALNQPGFYKNAFKDYMPTGVMTGFVTSSTGATLDETETAQVISEAAKNVSDEGTLVNKDNVSNDSTEKVIAKVTPGKADQSIVQQVQGEQPGVRTDVVPATSQAAKDFISGKTTAPAPAPTAITPGIIGGETPGMGGEVNLDMPKDPSHSYETLFGSTKPTFPSLTGGETPGMGGELRTDRPQVPSYSYEQLFGARPGVQLSQAPDSPLLDDMGYARPAIDPSGVSEMMPGRMEWQLEEGTPTFTEGFYGDIDDQVTGIPKYKPTGMADYYTEVRDPSEMFDVHSDPAYLNPDAQFLRQFPYSPPATPPGGINMYSPVPVAPVTPGPTGSERLGTPTQPLTGPSNPPGWPGAPPISLDMGGEYGTGVEPIRTHPLEGEFNIRPFDTVNSLFRNYLKQGWGIESEMDYQNFMKTPAGMNAFRNFNQPTAAGYGGSGGIG